MAIHMDTSQTWRRWGSSSPTDSFCGFEWRLPRDETPPLAAHLITEQVGYSHHGIYVGDGYVMHYSGMSRWWCAGPVQEVSLTDFSGGRAIWVRPHLNPRFDAQEVIRRARSRLGEDCYRILSNNCEHFCEWCLQGKSRSRQVETLRGQPRRLLAFGLSLGAQLQRHLSLEPLE